MRSTLASNPLVKHVRNLCSGLNISSEEKAASSQTELAQKKTAYTKGIEMKATAAALASRKLPKQL
jgi:hypothetical protein